VSEHDEARRQAREAAEQELGISREYLCREPWESYYILRRGILPCCHGSKPIAPMSEWATAWNSPQSQEIRRCLAEGRLSAYCLESLGCPVTQRYLEERRRKALIPGLAPSGRPPLLRRVNRLFGGLPARLYRKLTGQA
jgi:hypothetical protein